MQARPKGTVPDQEGSVVHLLEKYELASGILSLIDDCAGDCGLSLRQAPYVDTTRIQARSPTTHNKSKHDPEMHQTNKGNPYYSFAKAHTGVDDVVVRMHSLTVLRPTLQT